MAPVYKTYRFLDKDPIIDLLRTIIKDRSATFEEISEASNINRNTLARWFYGDTKRPQHASVMAVARALGYDYQLVFVGERKFLKLVHSKKANP